MVAVKGIGGNTQPVIVCALNADTFGIYTLKSNRVTPMPFYDTLSEVEYNSLSEAEYNPLLEFDTGSGTTVTVAITGASHTVRTDPLTWGAPVFFEENSISYVCFECYLDNSVQTPPDLTDIKLELYDPNGLMLVKNLGNPTSIDGTLIKYTGISFVSLGVDPGLYVFKLSQISNVQLLAEGSFTIEPGGA